jgi:cyanate permease
MVRKLPGSCGLDRVAWSKRRWHDRCPGPPVRNRARRIYGDNDRVRAGCPCSSLTTCPFRTPASSSGHWPVSRRAEADGTVAAAGAPTWTRAKALRTFALRSVVATVGTGMMVQIGFLTHQVTLISRLLGASGASAMVSATAIAALLGRLVLARSGDQINQQTTTAAVLALAAARLTTLALLPVPAVFVGGSVLFGLTVGNVTTLSPIIVRREFGAASFGAIFGIASSGIQLVTTLGPSFYGLLHDAFGGYRVPLLLAAALDILASTIILIGAASRLRRC